MGDSGTAGSKAAEGLGTSLAKSMQKHFKEGIEVYDKPLYAGMSDRTKEGLNATVAAARNGADGIQAATDWNQGLLTSGGMTPGMTGSMNATGKIADTYGGIADNLSGRSQAAVQYGNIADRLAGASAAQGAFGDVAKDYSGRSQAAVQYGNMADRLAGRSDADKAFAGMASGAQDRSLTEQQLMNVAKGGAFGQNAPGYARLRQDALDDALGGVGSAFLTNGRFGSNVMGDAAGEAATGVLAGMDYQNYQNDIGRQERALGAIEGQRQQGFQNAFNATGAQDASRLSQIGARMGAIGASDQARMAQSGMFMDATGRGDTARLNNLNTRMGAIGAADNARLGQIGAQMGALGAEQGAIGQQFGMGQQGIANAGAAAAAAPGLFQAGQMPGQAITAAGQMRDADTQATLLADADLFDRQKNKAENHISRYLGMLGQLNGQPGTQQETPWWQTAMGYVAGNAGNAVKAMGG